MFFIGGIPALITLVICSRVRESEAWHASRTDWGTYRAAISKNWRLFCYVVVLMAMMNFMSNGTQDMYPTVPATPAPLFCEPDRTRYYHFHDWRHMRGNHLWTVL
jgi:hypothetical protein